MSSGVGASDGRLAPGGEKALIPWREPRDGVATPGRGKQKAAESESAGEESVAAGPHQTDAARVTATG